jgi:DNA modification methylase
MPSRGRPRVYHGDRPATAAERQAQRRQRTAVTLPALALPPDIPCKTFGGLCTIYHADCHTLLPLLPRAAAIVTDPSYLVKGKGFDYTKTRRRASHWDRNYAGLDQPFDPSPWLAFPEVILCGANHYWDARMARGTWVYWDKTEGKNPGNFARFELIWLSMPRPAQVFEHLHRGGMRRGELNYVHLKRKRHPAEKPPELMDFLVKHTSAPLVIDPYMGSGTTMVVCLRLGLRSIGIEIDAGWFDEACTWLQDEVAALGVVA